MSPLGGLYRREVDRLRHRYPTLEPRDVDRMVTLSLVRAFLDVEAADLAQAMAEGNPCIQTQAAEDAAAYIARTVAAALAIVAQERGRADDTNRAQASAADRLHLDSDETASR